MFTNLDFLKVGNQFPPSNETYRNRQENYINGRLLYDGRLDLVFKDAWSKIKSRLNGQEKVFLVLNLFRPLTETFKLLAFQTEPEIWIGEGESAVKLEEYEGIEYEAKKAIYLIKSAFISAHAQGTGVYKLYSKENGEYDIALVNPENWVPVYEENDLNTIKCHVVSKIYDINNSVSFLGVNTTSTKRYLECEVHYKGYYDYFKLELDSRTNQIKSKIEEKTGVKTGVEDFAVFPFDYGHTCWQGYGLSAYNDLIPIVEEIIVRYSNNSLILDKHADPTLIAPAEAFEINQRTGEKQIRTGEALQMGRNGEVPQYVTWDGNLTAAYKQIEDMMGLYYMISGTNPQLFGQDIAGNLSGEALQKVLIVPLAKTKEMLKALEDASEKAFTALLNIMGIKENVYITFNAANFVSAQEMAQALLQQKQGGILSTRTALEMLHTDWDKKDVEGELELIAEEKASETAINLEDLYPKDVEDEQ